MDPYHLFLIFLAIYVSVLIVVGLLSSKGQRSVTDFWLAGRELGTWTIGFSAAASWVTASALLLSTGLFLLIGVGSIWIWVFPNIAALLIMSLISSRIKDIPALTQPELMEIRYDPAVRAPVALAVTVMMILFSVVDFIGFKLVLWTFFGIEPLYAVLLMAGCVAFYVGIGGFKAVVRTDLIQYLLLAGLAAFAAYLAVARPAGDGISIASVAASMSADWWDPFVLGGIFGALTLQLALLPGWVAEQDPWQKIWAAKDGRSARRGLVLGACLMSLVYALCFLTALGISALYPAPAGEVEAEMLYLRLIAENVSPALLALLTIGFAAASMSCTDTFATSGASCISRDLVQRFIRPGATMREMMMINRLLVIAMISLSAFIAYNVESIMDAVIIATVIGTTSYFFPIIGGLFWRRATAPGALAALVAGGGAQVALISYELFWLKAPLDTISPLLTEHGVLVGLTLSAVLFVAVSLATPMTEAVRLAPFFPDVAAEVYGGRALQVNRESSSYREVQAGIDERVSGERARLDLYVDLLPIKADGGAINSELRWDDFVERLKSLHGTWYTPTGTHIVYRLSQADMLGCVRMVRGDRLQIWLSAEPRLGQVERERDEIYLSYEEIADALEDFGLLATPARGV